ncbi:MAG: hypothetical protein K8L97_06070 [Anaerolineae bacterium]|nr:hypothetical protein [Anaerolineae bacterium]
MAKSDDFSKIFVSADNGQGKNDSSGKRYGKVFTEAHRREMRGVVERETSLVLSGKDENALFITALCNNWSADKVRAVAKQRGMNWRFAAALSDQILRIEGWAILAMQAQAVGADLITYLVQKAGLTISKINQLAASYERQDEMDNHLAQILEEAKDDLVELTRASRQSYLDDIKRILSGNG